MDDDQRDRGDLPESGAAPEGAAEEQAPAAPEPEQPAEPAEPASEPSEPVASTEPEVPSAPEPVWPTEPPEAGSAADDTWPTTPPERGEEPILEPPGEAEAYPAAAAAAAAAAAEPAPIEAEAIPAEQAMPAAATEAPPVEAEAYPATSQETAAAAAAGAQTVPETESATGESTQCPRCGTENRPGLAFCRSCGQRLVAAGAAATVERPGTPEGTMACPRCGTHNRSGVAFCQNCGANLRGTAEGYVPPAVAGEPVATGATATRGGAVLGPVVLLIGLIGLITGYLLPFLYGSGSLFERAFGSGGYGIAFWTAYPEVDAQLADQIYFGLAAPVPILAVLLLVLAVAGFARAAPGGLQRIGLIVALVWSLALIVMFVVVELAGNWNGDLVGMLRTLSPAGIIFFLSSLIVVIGTLTRFARS